MKRSKYLETLSFEHHDGLVIAMRVKNDLKKEHQPKHLIPYISDMYKNDLLHHFKQEEESFVNLMRKFREADRVINQMLEEHQQFAGIFEKIELLDTDVFEHIIAFARLLHDHIRFEERELFPIIEDLLDSGELEKISIYLHREHKPLNKECRV